jgi:hypothetical protein
MVVEIIKLYKLSRCRMALNCGCVFSLLIFGGCALFSFIGVEVLFLVLRVGRSFNASGLLGFVYIILFFMF